MERIHSVLQGVWLQAAHLWDLVVHSGFPLLFWVQPRFSVDQMSNQGGKIILITGANSGTGFASAWALYEAGAKVYLACRNKEKAQKAIEFIQSHRWKGKTGKVSGELVFLEMDLSDLHSVKRAVEEFKRKESTLNVLMCNAGIMATAQGQYTAQNYTLQFGTNVLGHHALIHYLLPTLLATSRASPENPARVLTLSSAGHAAAPRGGVYYQSVTSTGRELDKWGEYGQAKWGDIALARYLHSVYGPGATLQSRRSGEGELLCYSMHPGMVATNLAGHLTGATFVKKYLSFLALFVVRYPDVGAGNQLWLTSMPSAEAKALAGEYIVPFQRVGRPRPDVLVEANVVRMWDWCEEQLRLHQ